jgi:CarboxypepD_reg-like domain
MFGQKDLSGQVLDASKAPIIGATINIKYKSIGSTTDLNGIFTLSSVFSSDTKLMNISNPNLFPHRILEKTTYANNSRAGKKRQQLSFYHCLENKSYPWGDLSNP